MSSLIASDTHFSSLPRDAYRWGLFSWLAEQARKYEVDQVLILGDLTECKDRHPSQLVTRLVNGIAEVAEVCPVYILAGNHDFSDPEWPFFSFVSGFANVFFIAEPIALHLTIAGERGRCSFLPATKDPITEWKKANLDLADYIFMHQTVYGVLLDNGTSSDFGLPLSFFQGIKAKIISGDIHVQQKLGCVEYVGSPYRIDFGDRYTPRCLLLDSKGQHDLRFPCLDKHLVEITGDGEIKLPKGTTIAPGDQVKIRVTLNRTELPIWPRIRAAAAATAAAGGWLVQGMTLNLVDTAQQPAPRASVELKRKDSAQLIREFGEAQGLEPELAEIGRMIVESMKV